MTHVPTRAFFKRPLAALLCVAALWPFLAHTAGEPAPTPTHPLVGTWSWTLFGGACGETYQYRSDGTMLSTSGQAVTQWLYSVSALPSAQGFYKVTETSTRQNGKKDCSGDVVEEAGTGITKFIQLSPGQDRLIACKAESLAACFGPLTRSR